MSNELTEPPINPIPKNRRRRIFLPGCWWRVALRFCFAKLRHESLPLCFARHASVRPGSGGAYRGCECQRKMKHDQMGEEYAMIRSGVAFQERNRPCGHGDCRRGNWLGRLSALVDARRMRSALLLGLAPLVLTGCGTAAATAPSQPLQSDLGRFDQPANPRAKRQSSNWRRRMATRMAGTTSTAMQMVNSSSLYRLDGQSRRNYQIQD